MMSRGRNLRPTLFQSGCRPHRCGRWGPVPVSSWPPGGSRGSRVSAFRPSIDPTDVGYRHYTLDLSHTAAARMDALALAERMGSGLSHVHLADGTGIPKDEHLVPGRGGQPCAELLE